MGAQLHLDKSAVPRAVDLLVVNIGQLCTVHEPALDATGPRRGAGLAELGIVAGGALAVAGGRIVGTGPAG